MNSEQSCSSTNLQCAAINRNSELRMKKLKRRNAKIVCLIQIYKKIRHLILELESREIEFGENYNEEEEERQARRLQKLTRRQLAIYRYLVKHEIIVDDDLNIIKEEAKPKLFVTLTDISELNDLLTEHVNREDEIKIFGQSYSIPFSHVTMDDVRKYMQAVQEKIGSVFPSDPLQFDQTVENITCEVNKEIKKFMEDKFKHNLDEWLLIGSESTKTVEADISPISFSAVPTWDAARIKLHEACSRGDLKLEDTTVDEDDTKMPPTADEIDNGEEDDEESINGEDSDILFLQQAIKENASDQESLADEENGSGTDCCIVYERILNAANKNDGDSIGYCEPTSAVDDDDDNDDDDDSDVISI